MKKQQPSGGRRPPPTSLHAKPQQEEYRRKRYRYQRGFLYIGYLMPFYLSPMLFYGTHGSFSLYCVTLTLSWWVIGPMPKAANAFLLMFCAPLLQVSDPQRLASNFFSADVLEALLLLVLSAADHDVHCRLAPWLALRCQADRVRLRWLFPAVCLGAFLLATRLPAAVVAVVLFAVIEPAVRYLEETSQRSPLGDPALLTVDEAERAILVLQRQGLLSSIPRSQPPSSSAPSTPHNLADHPLNWYTPPRYQCQPPAKTMAEAMAAAAAARMPSNAAAPMQGPSVKRKSMVVGEDRSRDSSLCSNLGARDGTRAPITSSQVSGTSSPPMVTPRFSIVSTGSAASVRSRRDLHGSVAGVDSGGTGSAATELPVRVITARSGNLTQPLTSSSRESSASRITGGSPRRQSVKGQATCLTSKTSSSTGLVSLADGGTRISSGRLHRNRPRSAHDDVGSHKTSASSGPISDVDEQTLEAEEKHRKYAEIRTAFLVGPVIMAVVGNVFSLWTLPSRFALPLAGTVHAGQDDGALDLWLWALLTLPGVFGVMLFCCSYFYVANLQQHEATKCSPGDQAISQAVQSKRTSPPPVPRKGRYLFLVYFITSSVILTGALILGAQPTQVWTLATLAVVAAGTSRWLACRRAFQRHNLVAGVPWNVLCVFGGSQLVTHLTVEGRLVEGFFELVSPSFWRGNSRLTNQLLLTAVACVLAEAVGVAQLCRLLLPILVTIVRFLH
ncbi:uncharacterized protein LOC144119698 [Amblyomma americanum]